ncbi:hypothetical protein [Pedobacter sp.]|uniref:hypothetical protein n=1 Tax=Pedobacter sp. TaxID=1411316 RepID=UPI003D7F988A
MNTTNKTTSDALQSLTTIAQEVANIQNSFSGKNQEDAKALLIELTSLHLAFIDERRIVEANAHAQVTELNNRINSFKETLSGLSSDASLNQNEIKTVKNNIRQASNELESLNSRTEKNDLFMDDLISTITNTSTAIHQYLKSDSVTAA